MSHQEHSTLARLAVFELGMDSEYSYLQKWAGIQWSSSRGQNFWYLRLEGYLNRIFCCTSLSERRQWGLNLSGSFGSTSRNLCCTVREAPVLWKLNRMLISWIQMSRSWLLHRNVPVLAHSCQQCQLSVVGTLLQGYEKSLQLTVADSVNFRAL